MDKGVIGDYHIRENSTIHLIQRLLGGAPSRKNYYQ